MKRLVTNIIIVLAFMATALPVHAQLRMGVKGGIIADKLHFNKNLLSGKNHTGLTLGLQFELSLPVTGLGVDASVMYAHRNDAITGLDKVYSRDCLEMPVHLKYGFNLLGANRFLVPYAFTGPNFSFLFNESEQDKWDNRASNTSWDVGFGVELLNHLQVQASYGIGLTKTFKQLGIMENGVEVEGRDHCWTVTAAYLF